MKHLKTFESINPNSPYNIERVYSFLEGINYNFEVENHDYSDFQFKFTYNNIELIVGKIGNMDANTEDMIGETYDYYFIHQGKHIYKQEKSVPKILKSLKQQFKEGKLN